MRIYTVTKGDQPLAVVRAVDPEDAIETALDIVGGESRRDALRAREPNDAEMVGWLERREDYALEAA